MSSLSDHFLFAYCSSSFQLSVTGLLYLLLNPELVFSLWQMSKYYPELSQVVSYWGCHSLLAFAFFGLTFFEFLSDSSPSPVAMHKGPQSNFTPGHTCQLICQFHFFLETSLLEPPILLLCWILLLSRSTMQLDFPCCCSVCGPLCPGSHVFIFLDLPPCFGGAHPLICSWERVHIFDTLHTFKKILIIPFPWIDNLAVYKIQTLK